MDGCARGWAAVRRATTGGTGTSVSTASGYRCSGTAGVGSGHGGMPRAGDGRLRQDAHRVRLRSRAPDVAHAGRPDDAAGPGAGRARRPAPRRRRADGQRRPDRHGARAGPDRGGHQGRRTRAGTSTWRTGSGTDDNPVFEDMHHATAHVVGASVEAFRQVWSGESLHSANITGGLHHAMPGSASGFCIYNDVAVGIQWLLDQGAERVAYVDVDVHHGDGVERIFWDDPRVLTVSLHETGQMLFPGTGFPHDLGGPDAPWDGGQRGAAAGHRRRRLAARLPCRRAPAAARVQAGGAGHPARLRLPHGGPARAPDAHRRRPAGHLPRPPRARPRGGGRALGRDRRRRLRPGRRRPAGLDAPARDRRRATRSSPADDGPEAWREHVRSTLGRARADRHLTDGRVPGWRDWPEGYDPDTWLDRAIHATRQEAFPLHGLDPLP